MIEMPLQCGGELVGRCPGYAAHRCEAVIVGTNRIAVLTGLTRLGSLGRELVRHLPLFVRKLRVVALSPVGDRGAQHHAGILRVKLRVKNQPQRGSEPAGKTKEAHNLPSIYGDRAEGGLQSFYMPTQETPAPEVLYSVAGRVATVILNRPDKLNAWTRNMEAEVRQAMLEASGDHNVRAIVLTGAGRGFCAGADM